MGRSSQYTKKKADEICNRIAEGEPLRVICRDQHMPAWRTVYDWISNNEEFAARIARARELGFDAIAEETLEIADETSRDTLSNDHGDYCNHEWVSRSKLRVETRLKLLAKWSPKKYGDRIQVDADVNLTNLTDEQLESRIAKRLAEAGIANAAGGEGEAEGTEQA